MPFRARGKEPMRQKAVISGVVLVVLLGIWWLVARPGFDSAGFYILAVVAALPVLWPHASPGRSPDALLFRQFEIDLPYIPAVEFLDMHHFGAPFEMRHIRPVIEFGRRWSDASHEFRSQRLDNHRRALIVAIASLDHLIGTTTWSSGNAQTVKDGALDDHLRSPARAEKLNQVAHAIVEGHQTLVRAARGADENRLQGVFVYAAACVVLAAPFVGVWYREHQEVERLSARVATLTRDADSLRTMNARLGTTIIRTIPPAGDSLRLEREEGAARLIRVKLASYLAESDSLARAYSGQFMPAEVSIAWFRRVVGYLRRSGLDKSYELEFIGAADPGDEVTYSGGATMPLAMQRRRALISGFIDRLREGSRF